MLTSEFEADPARGAYPGEPVPERAPISHLALVERADVYLIAPASANTLAKLAAGAADNLVTTAALAAACPVVVAPAMNNRMYLNPATQANLRTLEERGVTVVPPGDGRACLARRAGRGPAARARRAACRVRGHRGVSCSGRRRSARHANRGDWVGVRVLVTAGGTREPIDSVRYIGNRSSGRMGLALAEAALTRGAEVTLVAANVSSADAGWSARGAGRNRRGAGCGMRRGVPRKRRAADGGGGRGLPPGGARRAQAQEDRTRGTPKQIELEPTEDVLSKLAAQRRADQIVVGFAAEHGQEAAAYGREKLERKRLDAIVINDISRADIGFDSDRQRGGDPDPRRRRAARPARGQGRGRRRRPRPGSAPARSCRRRRPAPP